MKNKFLISCITLIVFFNFTIPSYALAAPQKAFSRNAAVKADKPATDAEDASGFLGAINKEADGSVPTYSYSSAKDLELPEYVLEGDSIKLKNNRPSFDIDGEPLVQKFVDEENYAPGQFSVKFRIPEEDPEAMEKLSAEEVFPRALEFPESGESYMISGQIKNENGVPMAGVQITSQSGITVAETLSDGTYSFSHNSASGWRYKPVKDGCVFSPSSRFYLVALTQNINNQDYTAGLSGEFNKTSISLAGLNISSMAWGDYNNDGYLDFLIVGGENYTGPTHAYLYKNNGNGTFSMIWNSGILGEQYPKVEWVDFNMDGFLDVAIEPNSNTIKLYKNNSGIGTFSQVSTQLPSYNYGTHTWGDFDNDGYPDLLIFGRISGNNYIKKLFHNNGLGIFTEIPTVGLSSCPNPVSMASGDFDNDGLLDFAVSSYQTTIYRNVGKNEINQQQFVPMSVIQSYGNMAWGDYNNDGYLDLALAADTISQAFSAYQVKIFRNDGMTGGNLVLTDVNANILQVACADLEWGDYDNDGDLDLHLYNGLEDAGLNTPNSWSGANFYAFYNEIYRNDGPGVNGQQIFTNIIAGIPGQENGASRWGDYDNDGYLDVATVGQDTTCGLQTFAAIYHNELGNGIFQPNTVPQEPAGLVAVVQGDDVTLSWQKATDNQTPQNGLSYNIYLGINDPYSISRISPLSQIPGGFRRVATIGAQNENNVWTVKGLPNGTYYWGVQAIDTAFSGSPFSIGGSFVINTSTTYSINGKITFGSYAFPNVNIKVTTGGNTYVATQTDSNGYYSIPNLPEDWEGTVTPEYSYGFFSFTPSSRSYTDLNSDKYFQDYTATTSDYFVVSGHVTCGGQPLPDVIISGGGYLGITNSDGYYAVYIPAGWPVTLTPELAGYTFNPPDKTFNPLQGNMTQDFEAFAITEVTVSGLVMDSFGNPIPGVTLTAATSTGIVPVTINADGSYSQIVTYNSTVTFTPSASGYSFAPSAKTFFNITTSKVQNFLGTVQLYSISGCVMENAYAGISGVNLIVDPDPPTPVPVTNATGRYSFSMPAGWVGTVTPSYSGYSFTPENRTNFPDPLNASIANWNFTGQPNTIKISGYVKENGVGIENVELREGSTVKAVSQSSGYYEFEVPDGWGNNTIIVPHYTPEKYDYVPVARSYTNVTSSKPNEDYEAVSKTFTVSGTVLTSGGQVPPGATVNGVAVDPVTGAYSIPNIAYGTAITLVPSAIGYTFTPPSATLTVTSNMAQNFVGMINTFTLTYNAGAGGSISGETPQTVNYNGSGTEVIAVPNTGYSFVSWSDGQTSASRTDTNVIANLNVTANFAIDTFTLTYNAGAGGSISGETPQTVNYNGSGTEVIAVPNTGYSFVSWSDGVLTAARTDANVVANLNVTANFAINTFTLTYNAGAGGSISGQTPQTVNYGANGTEVTAVPNTGYSFVSWSDGQTSASRTDANVVANLNVTANFAINTFTLTYNAGPGGSISGLTPQTVNYNGSGTEVIAVPNIGYSFVSWSDGQTSASRTDTNVMANLNVTANFEISVFTVSGTVLTSGGQVPPGATVNGVPVDPVTGFYSIANIAYGTAITLVPSAIGYIFTPPNATLTVMSNMTQNFIGKLIYFNITGMVHTPNGPGEGFSMNVTNNNPNLPAVASTVSQSDGTYALSVPYGWSGIVTAAKAGYIIVHPENAQYTYENVLSDQAEKNYKSVLERYTISGLIEYANGSGPVEGVQLKDDADNLLATTDASGFYSFEEDYGWSAVVRPYKDNHVFDPVEREYIDLQSNQVEQNYKAKKESIVISGYIVSSPNDVVLAGVVLKDQDGTILATTDMNGAYSFEKPIGWSGVVTPSKPKYAFTPKQRKYENVQVNLSEEHYVATRAGDISHL